MDPNYSFPRQQVPIPRTRPLHSPASSGSSVNRESNALRASVLDAALQLGIGSNSVVAAWMFNNPVLEEDEEDQVSPSLTYGSSAVSDESFHPFPSTPSSSTQASNQQELYPLSSGVDAFISVNTVPSKPSEPESSSFATSDITFKLPDGSSNVSFPSIPVPPRPTTPGDTRRKLKKKRADGYESDGGYISEGGNKKDKKDKKKKEKEDAERKDSGMGDDSEPKEARKKKKSFVTLKYSKKSEKVDYAAGYETDGAAASRKGDKSKTKSKKSKKASGDAGYESDGGYRSSTPGVKKSKTRFFKIGSKSSKPDLRQEVEQPDNVSFGDKERDPMPLPIAGRFATTLAQPLPITPQIPTPTSTSSTLPSRRPIPQDLVLPPISVDPFPIDPSSSTPSPREHVAVRDSHISAMSATSTSTSTSSSGSHHKRKFFHFPGIRETGHGQGDGSNSTITSSSQVRSPSPSSSPPTFTSAKYPPISFPVTRVPSPAPGLSSSPLPTSNPSWDLKRAPDASTLSPYALPSRSHTSSRAPSPSSSSVGFAPNSTYVTITPTGIASGLPASPRPRNPPTDGFGPRTRVAPGGSPAIAPPSPHQPTNLTISPSSEFSGPSTRNSSLHSPNVLAYYDMPPPSPPPSLPLPRVPQDSGASAVPRPPALSRVIPEVNQSLSVGSSIQRGRESPFPLNPQPISRSASPAGLGFNSRPAISRYEEFNYGYNGRAMDKDDLSPLAPGIDVVAPSEDGRSFWEEEDDDEDDMKDVLQRFEDTGSEDHDGERVLESRRSFEAIKKNYTSLETTSQLDDDDDEQIVRKSMESNSEDRNHRWSGSIYSRASFLDPDKSEETRNRFLKRVESMLNEDGRDREVSAIPPVPKLPDGFMGAKIATVATPGRSWNRF